ncbi:4516_t:CDS:1, partial [Acaulospora colombiana]
LPQRQKLMDNMLQLSDPTTTTNRKVIKNKTSSPASSKSSI